MNVVSNAVTTATVLDEPRVIDVLRGHLAGRVGPGVTVDVGVLGLPARTAPSGAPAVDGLVYPVRLYGGTVLMGPLYRADGTSQPCGRCLDRRWLALRPVEERRPIEEGADVWMSGDESSLTPSPWNRSPRWCTRRRPTATSPPASGGSDGSWNCGPAT